MSLTVPFVLYLSQVLHVISCLIRTGDAEMKLILTNIICKLATCEVNEHRNLIDSHFNEAFTNLLQDSNTIVRINLHRTLNSYQNKYIHSLVSNIVEENDLQETLKNIQYDAKEFQGKYTHKCLRNADVSALSVELKDANLEEFYFDSGGSEMLVETVFEEPSSKRGKPNTHEVDSVVRNLEENVSLLVKQTVYTPEQLIRIQNVCDKLKYILK